MALGTVGMASGDSVFAYVIIWCPQEETLEGGEKFRTAKFCGCAWSRIWRYGIKECVIFGLPASPHPLSLANCIGTIISNV